MERMCPKTGGPCAFAKSLEVASQLPMSDSSHRCLEFVTRDTYEDRCAGICSGETDGHCGNSRLKDMEHLVRTQANFMGLSDEFVEKNFSFTK